MEMERNDEEIITNEQDEDHQNLEQNTCKQDENRDEVLEDTNKAKGEVELREKGFEIESLKKPKQSLKQNIPKTKVTVPKPFSLATDKRKIERESRPYGDVVKENAPTLTRSRSMINHRILPQVSNGGERISVLSRSRTLKPTSQASLPPKIIARKHADSISENGRKAKSTTQGKEIGKKEPQSDSKLGVVDAKKQTKTNTFKALLLPSFYHKKDPLPTSETKKIPIKDVKTMLPIKERKSMGITGDKVRVSKSVTSSAKETIGKLLKTTHTNRTRSDEFAKVVVVSDA